jgi:hypothetical protein
MARFTINDGDRAEWVSNDEGLYDLMRASRLGKRRWVRENRALIDEVIRAVTESERPAHYLKYGH